MAEIFRMGDDLVAPLLSGAVCAFGVFDGVHRGHRYIIDQAIYQAEQAGKSTCLLTFDKDPDEIFRAGSLKKLLGNERRLEILASCGADSVAVIPFTPEFAALKPSVFLDTCFGEQTHYAIHVGCGFRFGASASGTAADLCAWGMDHNMDVTVHDLFQVDGIPVTATYIRALLEECKIEQANELLGRSYSISGKVEAGRGEGHDLGFATANINLPAQMRVLGDGVYAAYATIDGNRWRAAVSVGIPPTFSDVAMANVEAHLLDFEGDLYGRDIDVSFIRWLRPMKKFDSQTDLMNAVMDNIEWVRANL